MRATYSAHLIRLDEDYTPWSFPSYNMLNIVFARSNTGIVGSNPTQGMDVCLCLFCVYVR
jgi:hypothetical protein